MRLGATADEVSAATMTAGRRQVAAVAHRRVAGEPVARIVGEKEFYGLTLSLSADTLIPRPDTETLVDAVLAGGASPGPVAILDLGTGTGAILFGAACRSSRMQRARRRRRQSRARWRPRGSQRRRFGLAERARFAVGDWAKGDRYEIRCGSRQSALHRQRGNRRPAG